MSSAKVNILIASYAKDYEWCEYNLRSILKFCTGFNSVTLLVPSGDVPLFARLEAKYSSPGLPVLVKHYLVYPGKGFNHHQAMKCYADVVCPDADFVLHTDSDCIFTAPTNPDLYFRDGKPIVLKRRYESIKFANDDSRGAYWWKEQTERALMFPVEFEFMQRHPAVHPRIVYKALREHIEANHCTPFLDYVLKQKESALQGYSEFNALGAYAFRFMRESYSWVDRDTEPLPPNTITQFWSWGGVDTKRREIEQVLRA